MEENGLNLKDIVAAISGVHMQWIREVAGIIWRDCTRGIEPGRKVEEEVEFATTHCPVFCNQAWELEIGGFSYVGGLEITC